MDIDEIKRQQEECEHPEAARWVYETQTFPINKRLICGVCALDLGRVVEAVTA